MDRYIAERLEDLGRVRQIIWEGVMKGIVTNPVVCTPEKFEEVWKDKMKELYERVYIMEQALDDASEICCRFEVMKDLGEDYNI